MAGKIECMCGKNCFRPIPRPPKTFENSVKFLLPELALELHPSKNGCFDLANVTPGSNYTVWWQCQQCYNEWPAIIYNRTHLKSGCPKCSVEQRSSLTRGKIKTPKLGSSLAERYPELAKYWHPTKNSISPDKVGPGSESSFWWLCENDHESYGTPNAKLSKMKKGPFPCKDCGFIRRSTPKPGHSFGDVFPEVAALWHPTMNEGRTPFDFKPHANEYAWWLCESGHSTEALINSRAAGFTCGECAIGQKSQIEEMFRCAVVSAGFLEGVPDGNARLDVPLRKRSVVLVDIFGTLLGSDQGVVIEYDGEYYHASEERRLMDLDKSYALLRAGFKVVRIREHELPLLGIVDDNFFEFNYHYASRQQMRLPENIETAVEKIKDWLQV